MSETTEQVKSALDGSINATVQLPVEVSHVERVVLALEHDIHSTWNLVTGMWAFSRGVPEEIVLAYQAESDTAMTSDHAAHPIATEPDPGLQNPPVKAAAGKT